MFGLYKESAIVAIIVLNEEQLNEYAQVVWGLHDLRPLVVHRLCVHPRAQHQGHAATLMNFAETHALYNGYRSIRLDAFLNNPFALRLYQRLDYTNCGTVQLRKGPFVCFEKILNPGN